MADEIFAHPRLVALYDVMDADRIDLDVYAELVDELGGRTVVDVGCGTGTFACLLALREKQVVGVDPAAASIEVARRKPGAERVQWVFGEVAHLPPTAVDVVTMTGNVAQVFLTDRDWVSTLRGTRSVLRPNGALVFEVRDPTREAWREWNRDSSHRRVRLPNDLGMVEAWVELIEVDLPLVSFRWTFAFERDGDELTSESTLRFRSREEVMRSLEETGFVIADIREAPDRPGLEHVFVARRRDP